MKLMKHLLMLIVCGLAVLPNSNDTLWFGDCDAWLTVEAIDPKCKPLYTPTNCVVTLTHEPKVAKTNNTWRITFER